MGMQDELNGTERIPGNSGAPQLSPNDTTPVNSFVPPQVMSPPESPCKSLLGLKKSRIALSFQWCNLLDKHRVRL